MGLTPMNGETGGNPFTILVKERKHKKETIVVTETCLWKAISFLILKVKLTKF